MTNRPPRSRPSGAESHRLGSAGDRLAEQRRVSRHGVRLDVVFEVANGQRHHAICRNIGLGGAFVVAGALPAVGASIVVYIPLPGLRVPAAIRATVRWCAKGGMGVQFVGMGIRETRGIVALISGH